MIEKLNIKNGDSLFVLVDKMNEIIDFINNDIQVKTTESYNSRFCNDNIPCPPSPLARNPL